MKFTTLEDLRNSEISDAEKFEILEAQYTERIKEQQILLDSARILGNTQLSLKAAIQQVINAIPGAFQYPEICVARYRFAKFSEQTSGFVETPWTLRRERASSDGQPIVLEVNYLKEKPPLDEGPFMKEELALAEALIDLILVAVNRQILMDDMKRQAIKSEIELKKAEFIIKNAPIPIFEILPDMQIIKSNPTFSEISGYDPDTILSMKLTDLKVSNRKGKTVTDVLESKKIESGEFEIDTPAGIKSFAYRYLPLYDSSGKIATIVNFYIDNTKEKQAVNDIINLTREAKAGHLGIRIDPDLYEGDLKLLVKGINETLDAVIGPLNIAAEYVDRISKGDIPPRITDAYNGDFNEIKNNLNLCIDAINLLVDDTGRLSRASVYGELDLRADADKHEGDFRKIINGINETIGRLVGLLDEMPIPCMIIDDAFSVKFMNRAGTELGDTTLQELLRQGTHCFNHFKTGDCKTENCACSQSMKSGKNTSRETKAHPGRHELDIAYQAVPLRDETGKIIGAFEIINDVTDIKRSEQITNKILQYQKTETEQLTKALDLLADGDLSISIQQAPADEDTKEVYEIFSGIYSSLNRSAEAIRNLIKDSKFLSEAAIDGKLDVRADADKHRGEYRRIIEGVNQTLDAVIGPVIEAMRIAQNYAHADFSDRIDPHLQVSGEFIQFKDSLNNIGIQVEFAVGEIRRIAGLYAEGNFTAEFDKTRTIEGDLAEVRYALDNISTNVSTVLAVISDQMVNLNQQAEMAGTGIEDVSRGATLIAKNAEQTQQNAERSEEGISQVLRTMEDLTRTIADVSTNAERVAQRSVEANELSKKGINAAEKADEGMQSITRTSEQAETIFSDIRIQMLEIGKIVSLITDIANQTNLLSLNAAIEAARAGDAGRGFAVVASEVKSLAERSRQSAQHISDMIGDLQKKSDAASSALGEAGLAVAEGSTALADTLSIFNDLTESVEDITKNMEMVASATEEQAASFEEITASVNEMSLLVRETAKDALNSSATSEEALAVVDQITKVINEINAVVSTIEGEMKHFSFKTG